MKALGMCLAGPTASGKTAVALALAERLPLEIISVDSALVYRGMDIGTAKPSLAERAAVPHHLIDILDPSGSYSAAAFAADAQRLAGEIRARGRLPLLVGGTMLYFKALRDGIDAMPAADPEVRAALDARATVEGWPALHAELARIDPVTAARLAPADSQRVQRALEVYVVSGRPLSEWHQPKATSQRDAWPMVSLEPASRAWLHRRVAERFDAMLAAGFVDEVRALRARRPEPRPAVHALRRLPPGVGGAGGRRPAPAAQRRHRRHAATRQATADLAALDARPAHRRERLSRRPRGRDLTAGITPR
jgi:tRNA dimethylallyltransferase